VKKIDLHIHTVPTASDSGFVFSMDTLKRYAKQSGLNAIAVTNHNIFDATQFRLIKDEIPIVVFPGIEINVGSGHLLLISDGNDLTNFDSRCQRISSAIKQATDSVSVPEIVSIFGDLSGYMLIPHYEKAPSIKGCDLIDLLPYICAGEVDSAKKFVRAIKDDSKLCPVLFSDSRMKEGLQILPTRQTYVDCGEISFESLKTCLKDKGKIFLSKENGNKLFQVFDDGQHISTGLNVLLGDRSTGKTYTLDRLNRIFNEVKYIRQFELVQRDEDADEKAFKTDIQRRRSRFVDDYLSGFRSILDDVAQVDVERNDRDVDTYVTSLLTSAEETDRRDAFSKVRLFDEIEFSVSSSDGLKKLIASVIHLVENVEYRETIEKHIKIESLKTLARDLIEQLWEKADVDRNRNYVNAIIRDVKDGLKMRTAATQVENVDLYRIAIEKEKVNRFNSIVTALQKDAIIFDENVQGFRIVASKGRYSHATELAEAIKTKASFKEVLNLYDDPYAFLMALLGHNKVNEADIYKLFVKISYRILNRNGSDVSGGERSEFRLLQEIKDAQNYDLLLIDEPESSFDNMFLKSDVNQLIKDISRSMPVVVVTHNNTVGASIKPDYIIYAKKSAEEGELRYRLYSGHPTDKQLWSVDSFAISNHEVLMNSLEAGRNAYEGRRLDYEAIEG
jgi:ABC-type dipeptide/oligopeptide/nickel transport system ATPase subunit